MKTYKRTFLELVFFLIIFIISGTALLNIEKIQDPILFPIQLRIFGYIFLIVLMIASVMIWVSDITEGSFYYEKFEIPKEDFKIDIYKNLHVWSYKDHAWVYIAGREKALKRKSIKAIQFYDRKRRKTYWKFLYEPTMVKNGS